MELIGRDCMKLFVFLHLSISVTFCIQCDARVSKYPFKKASQLSATSSIIKSTNKLKQFNHLEMEQLSDSSNTQPYVSSPFTLPPFESLPPMPLPQNTPPYCENPPTTQQPPSTTSPSTPTVYPTPTSPTSPPPPQFTYSSPPNLPLETPPPSPTSYTPGTPDYMLSPPSYTPGTPDYMLSPPSYTPGTPDYMPNPPSYTPGTPEYVPSPPETVPNTPGYEFSPPESEPGTPTTPGYEPNPPIYYPSPTGGNTPSPSPPTFNPGGPTIFLPPVVYPPPAVPPPPHKNPSYALWCVAKPSVPEPIIQEAMNYACGSGADCGSIQPAGSCFQPDTLFAHASYAFNSYWQRTKVAGGTCDFGGTAILVTVDPSFDGCHFIYY